MRNVPLVVVYTFVVGATPALAADINTEDVLSACRHTSGCSYRESKPGQYDGYDQGNDTLFTCWKADGCVGGRVVSGHIRGGEVGGIKLPAVGAGRFGPRRRGNN